MNTCHFCKIDVGREPQIGLICGVCFSCAVDRPPVFDACLSGTFDFEKFTAEGGKQAGTTVQTLILSKDRFETRDEAAEWVISNGFRADKVDESEMSFRFRQRDPGDFNPDGFGPGEQFRTISLSEGVSAVIGFPIEKADHTRPLNSDGTCPSGFRRQGNICVRTQSAKEDIVEKRRAHPFVKVDDEKRLISGPVLIPNARDLQGDFELIEDIEKAAHGFMMNRARKIGEQHQIFDGIGDPVESHLLRIETTFKGGKSLPAGTWIMTVKVANNSTWNKIKDGRITGFSIGYRGMRSEVKGAIVISGAKDAQSNIKHLGLFHLHDIDVHEVSLVDRGAIDEEFTEVKKAEPLDRKAAGNKWIVSVVRDRIKSGEISAVMVDETGIKSGREASDAELLRLAKAIGLKGVDPTGEKETMNKEEMKKFVEGLLEPFTKSLGELKKVLGGIQKTADDKKKAEEKAAKEKKEKGKPEVSEEIKAALAPVMEKLATIEKGQEQIVKDTIGRFEDLEKHVGAKSEKIDGQDDEDDDKKKVKWPSFAGRSGRS